MSGKTNKRIYFTVQAPDARHVQVFGSFNDWSGRDLKLTRAGVWKTWLSLHPGSHEYRFRVDGAWTNDPDAPTTVNPFGTENSVQVVE